MIYVEGLVDTKNINDFEIRSFTEKWKNSEVTSASEIEHFIDWFISHKARIIRSSMMREESGWDHLQCSLKQMHLKQLILC